MLFNDLYVGVPPGQPYPDYTEILRFNSPLNGKDFSFDSPMMVSVESDLEKDSLNASRIYN